MARVVLRTATGPPSERYTRTDADGTYEFRNVPAGRFVATASKARFVTLRFGQQFPAVSDTPIEITAGRSLDRIDFALPRAAAITGRVFDDLGDPIERAYVAPMKMGYGTSGRALVAAGATAVTNDAGQYRISQLQPGDYYVVASERGDGFGSEMDADIGFFKTAYPSTADIRQARPVSVRAGQDTIGIDIAMLPAESAEVSGTVLTADGQPAANVWLVLQAIGDGPGLGLGGDTRSAGGGHFSFPRVLPGRYELHARLTAKPAEGAVVPLTVSGDDVRNLSVLLTRGGRMKGRVVTPENTTAVSARDLQISAIPVNDTLMFGTGFGGAVNADWTFDWDFLLGKRLIRPSRVPAGWHLKAVMRGAEDITDRPIAFAGDEVIDTLEIIFTTESTLVTGHAVSRENRPLERYTVIAFADDPDRWSGRSRYIQVARSDASGQFRLEDLPPEEYRIAAVAEVEENQWFDAEFLERLRPAASRVPLKGGQGLTLTLRVVQP